MIIVSACLLGENCKYSGGNNKSENVIKYLENKEYILVCPEQLGGLSSITTNQRLYKVIQPNAIHQYNFQSKQWNMVHT